MRNPELWERLREFRVDDGNPVLPFTARLARENGWKRVSIEVVAVEYARAEDASPAAIRHHRP